MSLLLTLASMGACAQGATSGADDDGTAQTPSRDAGLAPLLEGQGDTAVAQPGVDGPAPRSDLPPRAVSLGTLPTPNDVTVNATVRSDTAPPAIGDGWIAQNPFVDARTGWAVGKNKSGAIAGCPGSPEPPGGCPAPAAPGCPGCPG
jgi:hypothetical protein